MIFICLRVVLVFIVFVDSIIGIGVGVEIVCDVFERFGVDIREILFKLEVLEI